MSKMHEQPEADRFWSNVRPEPGDRCWLWSGALQSMGYGAFRPVRGGRKVLAHRYSYQLHFGPVDDGLCVLHRCDTPRCVNPSHLFVGTHADNVADKCRKGRQARGETHTSAKLTDAQVSEIRLFAAANIPQREIAEIYGIGQPQVSRLVNRRSRK